MFDPLGIYRIPSEMTGLPFPCNPTAERYGSAGVNNKNKK